MNVKRNMQYFVVMMLISTSVGAVMPASGLSSQRSVATQPAGAPIERGGTITDIDLAKRLVSVDGVNYAFSPDATPMTYRDSETVTSASRLKQGMKIEFVSRKGVGPMEEITSIQIVSNPPK